MKRRVLILGAGGHGQVVADILLAASRCGAVDVPIGFLDDAEDLVGSTVLGLPVMGTVAQLPEMTYDAVIVAIGENSTRQRLTLALREQRVPFANAIHPRASIACDVSLGLGVMVCAHVVVNTGSTVGNGVILNTASSVDHHNYLGEYAHIAPGSHLGGAVRIGEGALIGIGSTVVPGRSVGDWALVAAGSVVTRDIPGHCQAAGVPARVIKKHKAEW